MRIATARARGIRAVLFLDRQKNQTDHHSRRPGAGTDDLANPEARAAVPKNVDKQEHNQRQHPDYDEYDSYDFPCTHISYLQFPLLILPHRLPR